SLIVNRESLIAVSITGIIDFICSRAACSGIIPPYLACREALDATILDNIVIRSSLLVNTAADVSSHVVSIPSIIISFK
ncbi:MAG: hypothetical protein Q8Q91_01025, partial [Candidatus Daviesbacteria bacterium]|nr:hypothetical protein [Candidatus Daviesbacteria bacterium]